MNRKLLFGLMGASVLMGLSACQSDDVLGDVAANQETTVTFTAQLPGAVTRAYGEAASAKNLQYFIYSNGVLATKGEVTIPDGSLSTNVSVDLVSGQEYEIYFWADKGTDSPYTFNTANQSVSISYGTEGNDDTRDAFYGKKTFTASGSTEQISLTRPFAQLNIGTSDYESVRGHYQISSVIIATKADTAIDLSGKEPVGIGEPVAVSFTAELPDETVEVFPLGNSYTYLSMNFLSVTDTEDVGISILSDGNSTIEHTIATVPFRPNYRTNIAGKLLTQKQGFEVTINPAFGDIWDGTTIVEPPYNEETNTYEVSNGAELAWFAAFVNGTLPTATRAASPANTNFTLEANVDLGGVEWEPVGSEAKHYCGTFDGGGYTISNFKVTKETIIEYAGFFGVLGDNGVVKNVTFKDVVLDGTKGVGTAVGFSYKGHISNIKAENITATGNGWMGGIVGYTYSPVVDCEVNNITLTAVPNAVEGGYDNGDKVGGLTGYVGENEYEVSGKVSNATIRGYRDLGGICGAAHKAVVSGEVSNVEIIVDKNTNAYADEAGNADAVLGRNITSATVGEYTATNVKVRYADIENIAISSLNQLKMFRNTVNAGYSYLKKTITLEADFDLQNEAWEPIGNSSNPFQGNFDGQEHTISNLYINKPGKNYVGFFGNTNSGSVTGLKIHNATVIARGNVGVVSGYPYTSKYSNITITGLVKVDGAFYVGGMFGKNLYVSASDLTINVEEGSYVNANSEEDGTAWRTYVGGLVGFMGEGGHEVKNVYTNINVIGTTCDAGGVTGIAHYGNKFTNCVAECDVTLTKAATRNLGTEIGGIAGVWHNQTGQTVTLTECSYKGTLTSILDGEEIDVTANTLTGTPYSTTGTGKLIVDGVIVAGGEEEAE